MSVTVRTSGEWLVGTQVARGIIREVSPKGSFFVQPEGDPSVLVECDVLVSAGALGLGTAVLFCPPTATDGRGCVLGAVGPYGVSAVPKTTEPTSDESMSLVADKTTIELTAETKLVLKCGEGSISIGKDGTIIIKGARILSRSKGVNKIKGAAVQIN
jgi:hypothetical protein